MVVDRVVAPPEFRAQFSEKLMVLPYSYFCNDHRQQPAWAGVPSAAVQRTDYAELPARGVLLACFNQLYKIDPPIFAVWMDVLVRFPHAHLWLLKFPSGLARPPRAPARPRARAPHATCRRRRRRSDPAPWAAGAGGARRAAALTRAAGG
jgi:predicted O-linked N-acetylglucosamine transferase (SPINDLY family)